MKMNFEHFQIQKWISQTVRFEKVDEKTSVIFLVFMFPFWVMVLRWPKKVHFLQFELISARNLNLLKQVTYMHLKGLVSLFQKMVLFIMLWLIALEILVFCSQRILLNFCWVSIFFDILIANISWTVAFLLRSAQNCKKCTFVKMIIFHGFL